MRVNSPWEKWSELGETTLGYFWNVIESGTGPLTLLYHVLPECLGTKQVETGTCDLELKASTGSTTTSGHNDGGDGRRRGAYRVLVSMTDIPAHEFVNQDFERDRLRAFVA